MTPPADALDPWTYAALLWASAWDANATFLHIPKTGGSVVEDVLPVGTINPPASGG